jgi:predicted amidophosphoribosyltransferase
MRLTCPKCKRPVVLSDKYTGDKDICPHCFTPIQIDPSKKFRVDMLKWKPAFITRSKKADKDETK